METILQALDKGRLPEVCRQNELTFLVARYLKKSVFFCVAINAGLKGALDAELGQFR
jgi:hypothetical protein